MADNTKKQIILSVGADTTQAGAGIDQLKTKLNGLSDTQLDKPFRGFKTEIKEATAEAARMEAQFGKNSQQFRDAALRVADLRDRFGEFNNSIKAFNPDNKLQALVSAGSAAIRTVQGLQAGINILGLQSGTAEQAIQRLQAVMALGDVLNNLGDIKNGFNDMLNVAKNAFKSLSKGDLIGIAIIGVTALATAVYALTQNTQDLNEKRREEIDQLASSSTEYKNAVSNVIQLTTNIDLAKKGFLNKEAVLKQFNETFGSTIGNAKNLNEAEDLLVKNADNYIKATLYKAAANAALAKAADAALKVAEQSAKRGPLDALQAEEEVVNSKEYKDRLRNVDGASTAETLKNYKELQKYKDERIKELLGGTDYVAQKFYENLSKDFIKLKSEVEKTFNPVPDPTPNPTPNPTTGSKGNKTEDKSLSRDVVRKTGNLPKLSDDAKTWEEISLKAEDSLNQKMLQKKYAYSAEVTNIEKGNLANTEQLSQLRYQTEENTTNGLIKLDKARLESNQALIGGISSGLQGLSQLAKKDSVAAKSLAAAGALIDTYAAITGILKSTAKTAAGGIPGYAIAQAVATGIFGMVQVRNILKTNVDGKGTGGDTSSISAPSLSTAPVINASAAQQQSVQDVRVTNQNQAPVRAYITNSDLVNNEQRNRFINTISTF